MTKRKKASKTAAPDRLPLLMKPTGAVTRGELVALRRDIHRHPEIGFEEKRTSALVRTHLEALGLAPRVLAGTGVSALIESSRPGRTLMLRCDLDALPMEEERTVPYKSVNRGVMHACGHDFHTAILLGTAKNLVGERPEKGRVKLNFQPAEEGLNGADRMVEAGIMRSPRVDAVLGYHIWQGIPVGKVAALTGPCMAAVGRFQITVTGKGGHAAYPHRSVDPILVAAHIVTALQSIVARNVNPIDTAVVTVGQIQAGTAFNIIPPQATMEGTVRTFSQDALRSVPKRVREIAVGVARAMGAKATVEYAHEHDAVVNDATMAEFMREVARDVVGSRNVIDAEPSMGGEDQASYQKLVPGCYSFFGAAPKKGEAFPHHHPQFNPDEGVLETGVAIMTEAARRWLARP
jgi:amidohydrolase